MILKNKPNRLLIAMFLLFIVSGTALAEDERVKVINGVKYFNGTEEEHNAYLAAQVEEMRAKAQAEADAKSKEWSGRMDAAFSGHPDANFEADNKANYDRWAVSHPAEVAQGVKDKAILDARTAQINEQVEAESARSREAFHQKMLAEGAARGIDGEAAYRFAIGESSVSPYDPYDGSAQHEKDWRAGKVGLRSLAPAQNITVVANPMTTNGTSVGLSPFTPAETVKTVTPPTDKKKNAAVQTVETRKSKPLVSYDSSHKDSRQK